MYAFNLFPLKIATAIDRMSEYCSGSPATDSDCYAHTELVTEGVFNIVTGSSPTTYYSVVLNKSRASRPPIPELGQRFRRFTGHSYLCCTAMSVGERLRHSVFHRPLPFSGEFISRCTLSVDCKQNSRSGSSTSNNMKRRVRACRNSKSDQRRTYNMRPASPTRALHGMIKKTKNRHTLMHRVA